MTRHCEYCGSEINDSLNRVFGQARFYSCYSDKCKSGKFPKSVSSIESLVKYTPSLKEKYEREFNIKL